MVMLSTKRPLLSSAGFTCCHLRSEGGERSCREELDDAIDGTSKLVLAAGSAEQSAALAVMRPAGNRSMERQVKTMGAWGSARDHAGWV